MPKEMEALVEEYRSGKISRRDFIQRAIIFTGSLAAATNLFESLFSSPAHAAMVDPANPALVSEMVQFAGKAGTVFAYQTRPKANGSYPGVVVIHANRGLSDHEEDVARRLAKEGYVGLAMDYLSRHGGTKKVNPKGQDVNIRQLAPAEAVVEDSEAAFTYLRSLSYVQDDRLGVVGFCSGGGMAFNVATRVRGLKAVVVYYGSSPRPIDAVERIEAPVLAHYGGEDQRINEGIPETEAAMKKYNKSYTYKIYPGARHAFSHDGRPDSYHPEAAKEAWARTLEYLKKQLKS